MQHHPANQLHIEVAHAQHPLAGFADHGERLGQDVFQDGALVLQAAGISQTFLKYRRLSPQVVVRKRRDLLLEERYQTPRLVALQLAGIGITQQELEHGDGSYR